MQDRETLLQEYDRLEDRIDSDSRLSTWALADWLVKNVPNPGRGRQIGKSENPNLSDLAKRRDRSVDWLTKARRVAAATSDNRLSGFTVWQYQAALKKAKWNLEQANEILQPTVSEPPVAFLVAMAGPTSKLGGIVNDVQEHGTSTY